MLRGKKILLGVTGGIAAYKSCYLVRELQRHGATVKVIMTKAATQFVTPLSFSALSGSEVAIDVWAANQTTSSDIGTRHIDLANWADLLLIAPASANTVAKISHGIADNLVTIVTMASRAPVVLSPSMDADMYRNSITQLNLASLRERGYFVLPANEGDHASGLKGPGRLPEVESIIAFIDDVLKKAHQDLKKKKILVTAGPTYEAIDPVRFIGNRSSGKMGFAIANAAAQRGAEVTLVSGPVSLETPRHVKRLDVESAEEMFEAVKARVKQVDAIVMAAAVADFAPAKPAKQKIKKTGPHETLDLQLNPTTDILQVLGQKKNGTVLVGFALETEKGVENARLKLKSKKLDMIVLNTLGEKGTAFGSDTNVVSIIQKDGTVAKLPRMHKFDIANEILTRVKSLL